MANRDASRIRFKWFEQTTVPTGSAAPPDPVDAASDVYICVTSGPNWTGFSRGDVETTCSNTGLDGWGNLIRQFRAGKIVDLGSITFVVDWDPDNDYGGRELAIFMDNRTGDIRLEFPAADSGEATGPIIVLTGHCNKFVPQGEVLADDNTARQCAEITFKISGMDVIAPAA
jgi:hypothetical protein